MSVQVSALLYILQTRTKDQMSWPQGDEAGFFFSISDTFPVHLVTTFSLEKVPFSLDSIL